MGIIFCLNVIIYKSIYPFVILILQSDWSEIVYNLRASLKNEETLVLF